MLYRILIACAAVFCVAGTAADITTRSINLDEGDTLPVSIITSTPIKGCYLVTPDNVTIEFKPENKAEERFELQSNPLSPCAVNVNNLSSKDSGIWRLFYTDDDDSVTDENDFVVTIGSNVAVSTDPPTQPSVPLPITLDEGESLELAIVTSTAIKGCFITSPNNSEIEFMPTNKAEIRFQLKDYSGSPCAVDVTDLSKDDEGLWTLYYTDENDIVIDESACDLTINKKDVIPPTPEEPPSVYLEEGHTLHTSVPTSSNFYGCYLKTPQNTTEEFKPQNKADSRFELRADNHVTQCSVDVKNVQEADNGVWIIYYTNEDHDVLGETSYNLTVTKPNTEDPIEREIEIMPAKKFDTNLGARLQVEIPKESSFFHVESCHLKTPGGDEHNINPYVTIPSIEVVAAVDSCKIIIDVTSEEEVGEWTLIAKAKRFTSDYIEKQLPVTIYVEEPVRALPQSIIISEGKDLYIRLETATKLHETCKLIAPNNANVTYEPDTRHTGSCGFIVRNVDETLGGTWSIVYEHKIVYRAEFHVTIGSSWNGPEDLTWYAGRSIDQVLGPVDAVFCRIVNPKGVIIFEGAENCRIILDSVTENDAGTWTLVVGLKGRVLTDEHTFQVNVEEVPQLEVSTNVQHLPGSILLTCFVSSEYEVTDCKFLKPSGQILMVNEGVGEDAYVSESNSSAVTSLRSKLHDHDCGIRLLNPEVEVFGTWRCDVATAHGTYYGFLSVVPTEDHPINDIGIELSGPVLKAVRSEILAVEGDTVVLSCSIQTAIRYCYFRYTNGTVFNVSPESEQYIGAGLQAGECGLRIPSALPSDSGDWTCNVGLFDDSTGFEQQDSIQLNVADALTFKSEVVSSDLVIEASTLNKAPMDYCRFVRIDGKGFTSDNVPSGYISHSDLKTGLCKVLISNASTLELHPWTVAVRIQGQQKEITRVTPFLAPDNGGSNNTESDVIYVWVKRSNPVALSLIILGFMFLLIGLMFSPKRNRHWAYARGSAFRSSVHRVFTRTSQESTQIPEKIPV